MAKRRGHNEGSFFQLPNGRWRGVITYRKPNGDVARKWFSDKTKRDVMAQAAAFARNPTDGSSTIDRSMTVSSYLDQWLRDVAAGTAGPTTLVGYRNSVERLQSEIGQHKLGALRAEHIQGAQARLLHTRCTPPCPSCPHARYSPGTVNNDMKLLRQALEHATGALEILARNPARRVRIVSRQRTQRPDLTDAQLGNLLTAAGADVRAPLWVLIGTTAMRIGEILALTWDDIDLDGRTVRVRATIGNHGGGGERSRARGPTKSAASDRDVPLMLGTAHVLAAYRERMIAGTGASGLLFHDGFGRPLWQESVRRWFRAMCKRAGLTLDLTPHDLRHAFSDAMKRAGVNPTVAADILGHADVRTTLRIYTRSTEQDRRAAVARVEESIGRFAAGFAAQPPIDERVRRRLLRKHKPERALERMRDASD